MGKVGTGASGFELVQSTYAFKENEKASYVAQRAMPMWITATTPGGNREAFVNIALKPHGGGATIRIGTQRNAPFSGGGASYATASGAVVVNVGDAIEVSRNPDAEYWTSIVVVAPEKVEFK